MKKGKQNSYVLPKYYTNKGNLKTRWYIEFEATDTITNTLKKKRVVCPTKFRTKKERDLWAKDVMNEISMLLTSGYNFSDGGSDYSLYTGILIKDLNKTIDLISQTLRPKTIVTYKSSINKLEMFINAAFPDIQTKDFTSKIAISFRDYLIIDLKNTSRTANNTFMHLRTVYNQYSERVDVPESPFVIKKLKTVQTNKNISFTEEDRKKLEDYLINNDPALYIVTRFIYYAFIRPGELNNLKFQHLDVKNGYISIPGEISKNGKSETVPIITPLQKAISEMKLGKPDEYIFARNLKAGISQAGKQIAFRRHEKIINLLGLKNKGYTLYSWKHTGAVNAYLAGVGIKELQSLLRHSSIQITDIYLKSLGLRTDPKINEYNW